MNNSTEKNLSETEDAESDAPSETDVGQSGAPSETDGEADVETDAKKKKGKRKKSKQPEKEVSYEGKIITKAQQRKITARRWIMMNVGILMMAASVFFFQNPNNFTLGGVAGIAILISGAVQSHVPFLTYDVVLAIINVALIILGVLILGKQCTLRTIFCSLAYTVEIWAMGQLIGPDKPIKLQFPLTGGELFLELCFAILLFGIGGAIVFNCGSSSGGTDIIALILKKFTKINVGMALMIIDLIVVMCSIVTFKDPQIFLYSFLGLFAKSFLLDGVIESMVKTKYITIVTKHQELIAPYILKVFNHGYTMYDAVGGYTHEPKKVLITVCKRGEALKLKVKLKEIDPEAFIIITDANEILGKGFGGTL